MKKLIVGLIFLISISVNAQIKQVEKSLYVEIGKVGGIGAFVSSLSVIKDTAVGGTNRYLWMYNNLKYQTITDINSISFTATDEDLDGLYQSLKTQVLAEKGTENTLELGQSRINFKTYRALGVSSLMIYDYSEVGAFFYITAKQLDKLFGKN